MSKLKLHLVGKASGRAIKTWTFINLKEVPDLNVLQFLRQEKVPIASSCYGEGVCHKCLFNTDQLACQFPLKNFFTNENEATIEISYL